MPAGQSSVVTGQSSDSEPGRLFVRTGWPRTRHVAASGAITAQSMARERARTTSARRAALIDQLEQALSTLTAAQYGRQSTLDDGALDEALATGNQVIKRARLEQTWVMRRLAARRVERQGDTRAWSR
jgi:hypothetical protein